MNEQQMQSLLDAWFRDREVTARDQHEGVARVVASVPRIRQQGRWLPFRLVHQRAQTPAATDTTEYQPIPTPATNGHAPTIIGRTQIMISPVKAVIGGALVFALGSVFLIAQPFEQQGGVPGAEQGADQLSSVFTLTPVGDPLKEGEWVYTPGPDGSAEFLDIEWTSLVEASDPRISGTWTEVYDFRGWEAPDDTGLPFSPSVTSGAVRIDNELGAWVGTYDGFGSAVGGHEWIQLRGEGAYEGLTALIQQSNDFVAEVQTYAGVIIPGELPAAQEPIESPAE